MPAYTTKSKIESYSNQTIDNSLTSYVNELIQAAGRLTDKYTNNSFESQDETRYYDGNGQRELIIDSFTSITSVEILEYETDDVMNTLTEGKSDDFVTWPYNEDVKYKLIMTPDSSVAGFYEGKRRVKIVAKFGNTKTDLTTPEDIVLANTIMVVDALSNVLTGSAAGINSESLGDYSVSYDNSQIDAEQNIDMSNVKMILDHYKIREL